mgnify:CR=1 FL=1
MATLSRRLVAGALSGALLMSAVFFTNAAPCAFAEQEKQPRVLADEPFPQIPVGAPLTGRQILRIAVTFVRAARGMFLGVVCSSVTCIRTR